MRIVCIGGGPAGLYFGLLMKGRNPQHEVTVVERNRPYDTFGWGVVFSDYARQPARGRRAQCHSGCALPAAQHKWNDSGSFATRRDG